MSDRSRSLPSRLGLVATATAIGLATLTAGPATAEPAVSFEVTAEFDQPLYRTGERMTIRFTVQNTGAEPATNVAVVPDSMRPDAIVTDGTSWGDLGRDGVDIAAGDAFSVDVTGSVTDPEVTTAVLAGYLYDTATGTGYHPFSFDVPVTPAFGQVSGVVYDDANDNAAFDPGEGLPGATVTASTYTTTTDAGGEFTFDRLPAGRLEVSATGPGGLRTGFQPITVDSSVPVDDLLLRAVRPLTDLSAALAFTQDSYAPGDLATVEVTLTNTGDRPHTGIVANCNRAGSSNALDGVGPGWGDLVGAGVTVDAHGSATFAVTEEVPAAALDFGTVRVACDFSYRNVELGSNPSAVDVADVPGGFGDLSGT